MSLDQWIDDHELGIDRTWFWASVVGVSLDLALALDGITSGLWVNTAIGLVGAVAWLAIGVSAADDAVYHRPSSLRPCQLWAKRLRRWTHVALMGWS